MWNPFGKRNQQPDPEPLPPAELEAAFREALALYEQQQPEQARQRLALGPGADWVAWWPEFAAGLPVAQGELLVRFSAVLAEPLTELVYETGRQLVLQDKDREIANAPPLESPHPDAGIDRDESMGSSVQPSGSEQSEVAKFYELMARLDGDRAPSDVSSGGHSETPLLQSRSNVSEAERYYQQAAQATAREAQDARSILQALDRQILTAEDLAYMTRLSRDRTRQILTELWDKGQIDTVDSSLLRKFFPFLRPRQPIQTDDYLTITVLGYFRIHPIIERA